ncbi:MAG: DUF294 nucleotidyltransferase-like domain-containing protein [Caldimonas sp.]
MSRAVLMSDTATSPSPTLLTTLAAELMRYAPFEQMASADVEAFVARSAQAYFAPGERILAPGDGPARYLHFVRRGSVSARWGEGEAETIHYEAGDSFPLAAVTSERAVAATYTAVEDCFCLLLPADEVRRLARDSPPFASFLHQRLLHYVELSRRRLQAAQASQTLSEQALEAPLGSLPRKLLVAVVAEAPLQQALTLMHERRAGSVLVLDREGRAQGILTRRDVLGRVTLPGVALATPVRAVMSQPVRTLNVDDTAHDAILAMSRHDIGHLPVTEGGCVVNIVSERDLFALQRLSLKGVGGAIRAADDVAGLVAAAQTIRRFVDSLLGQGVGARQLTELISHLNDVLTERLVQLTAARHGLDLQRACWLAFGSEGRSEQTIATDQDNGLVFESNDPSRDRPGWLRFALDVNQALDACGYPLCRGNVMASNPDCCLSPVEWRDRFAGWIEHGAPNDLLHASIYFDFRPIAGRAELMAPLREAVAGPAGRTPRFIRQLAENALQVQPPLNWVGGLETRRVAGHETIDIKLQGTALFVDVARIYALAHGCTETNTRRRLLAVAQPLGAPPHEAESWAAAFEFLQMLRLQTQKQSRGSGPAPASTVNPNLVDVGALHDIDRRLLKDSLRVGKLLRQRLQLDYLR